MTTQNFVGYARVSTTDQDAALQEDALKHAGVLKTFTDKVSGTSKIRPGWDACMDYLQPGNVLVVWKLDRVGRSTAELAQIVVQLAHRGIHFKSLTESFIDTTTADGRLIFHIFAALAEHERNRLIERTQAGLTAARDRGRVGGRPTTVTDEQLREAKRMRSEGMTIVEAARILKVGRMSLSRALQRSAEEMEHA